jgi:molecular chaperone HtpG
MSKIQQSFNAEIKQLLDIVIHSLYSQREIFLRELISNASDAIDKLKFESLQNPTLLPENTAPFEIRLEAHKEARLLKITDNGIGMTPDEVQQFIGTIAKSGTKAFSQMQNQMKTAGASKSELIGQFGVGFYSAFMVADKVTLHTQKAGTTEGTQWESGGDGHYSMESMPRAEGHGTTITLHLKTFEETKHEDGSTEAAQDFSDTWTLRSLVKKYSDFIPWPIKMKVEQKKDNETVIEDETLNSQKALWLRSPSEVKSEEYDEFYQHLTHDWGKPARHVHYRAEGVTEFTALLYVPSQKPWNYYTKEYDFGLNLYIKRVFIMSHCKDLLPPYLRFVRGLVDSSDLALNVSRELLQQDRLVTQIRKNVVNKALSMLKEWLGKDRTTYETFWADFGSTLKEGIPTEPAMKEKLQELFLFRSTTGAGWTTLAEYVARMKPEQKDIYFIVGEKIEQIQNSPYLEKLKQKGYEVLLLTDAIDEWVVQGLTEYQSKKLVSITKEGLELDSDEEKKQKEETKKSQQERFGSLLEKIKTQLKEHVKDVVVSDRLTETPVCLVSSQQDLSANMQKILSKMEGMDAPSSKRILEVNLNHGLFEQMQKLDDAQIASWSEILYNQALLAEGSTLPDLPRFTKLLSELMLGSGRLN